MVFIFKNLISLRLKNHSYIYMELELCKLHSLNLKSQQIFVKFETK